MRRLLATSGALALAATSGLLLATVGLASAATTPISYEPDPNSVGTLTFYDAMGHVVTGGTVSNSPTGNAAISAFVVGSTLVHGTDTKETLYYATPAPGTDSSTWSKANVAGAETITTTRPTSPAPLTNTTLPVYAGKSTDKSLPNYAAGVPSTATGATANIYQVRLYTSTPGNSSTNAGSGVYDEADVQLVQDPTNSAVDDWTLVYPTTTPTTTTVALNPAAPTTATPATLTGTDNQASVPGTMTFLDGTTVLGAPVSVGSNGAATSAPFTPTAGQHAYTARFDPTPGYSDGSAPAGSLNQYSDSTSPADNVTVAPATVTPPASLPEAPYTAILALTGLAAGGVLVMRKSRKA